jgi:hypothetical protein
VLLAVHQGEEDVEQRRREREERLWIAIGRHHDVSLYIVTRPILNDRIRPERLDVSVSTSQLAVLREGLAALSYALPG